MVTEEPLPSQSLPENSPVSQRSSTKKEAVQGMNGLLAERLAEGGGALCNDQNGQCLGFRGDIDASKSGVFTAIAKLAGQLDSTVDGAGSDRREVPLVTIQTEKATLLVKEYGGRTVVFRVPAEAGKAAGDGEHANGVETS